MPWAPRSPCQEPRCPHRAVHRGRCAIHRRSDEQRGYGREWRTVRAAVRAEQRRRALPLMASAIAALSRGLAVHSAAPAVNGEMRAARLLAR